MQKFFYNHRGHRKIKLPKSLPCECGGVATWKHQRESLSWSRHAQIRYYWECPQCRNGATGNGTIDFNNRFHAMKNFLEFCGQPNIVVIYNEQAL
jgi:hypothetical protein